eukprot:s4211_g2.t1
METSGRQTCQHANQSAQSIQSLLGDKWETSVKSCTPEHSEHPELTGRQVGDKWRQVGDKCEVMRTRSIQSLLGDKWETSGDKWETSVKACGPEHSEHPAFTGRHVEQKWRQVADRGEIMRTRALRAPRAYRETSGDKRETSVTFCGPEHSELHGRQVGNKWRQVGDKCEFMQTRALRAPRAVGASGDKSEIMRTRALRAPRPFWETSERQVKTSGRQVRNHADQSAQSIQSLLGDKWETSVKACGQSTQSNHRCVGDKWETNVPTCKPERSEHPELTERQVGDK